MVKDAAVWHEWGKDAFDKAKAQNKLILLDISASWCHWCHVMDQTTYRDPRVIQLLNSKFVAVRVDTDKRPDVNARYNLGGWPTTAVLTPDRDLFGGATYIPPSQMIELLEKAESVFRTEKKALEQVVKPQEQELPEGKPDAEIVELYRSWLEELYDDQHGGFGREPKFPQANIYGLLFALASEGKGWNDRLVLTLQRMAGGELFDRVEGGFFRYATRRDWTEPHYEKLLDDNAHLLSIYLKAYVTLKDPLFKRTAEQTLDYMIKTLFDANGKYFYGSQAADEEYYKLSAPERSKRKPPPVDRTLYADWNAAAISALLRASLVLQNPEYKRIALEVLQTILDRCFDGEHVYHYHPREAFTPATLSDSIELLGALLEAYQYTLDKEWLLRAIDVADATIGIFGSDGAFYDIAHTEEQGFLSVKNKNADENGAAIKALMKLHALTGEERYKNVAANAMNELAGIVKTKNLFAPQYVEVLLYEMRGLIEVDLTGQIKDLEPLQKAALFKMDDRIVLKHEAGKEIRATVCVKQTCNGPFATAEQLFGALEAM